MSETWGLEDVTVRFGGRLALDHVTMAVTPSNVTVVVGGDGAGKSTCLKALVGLVGADGGSIRRPPKEDIGYVPATVGLYTDLTVEENLVFTERAFGGERLPGPEIAEMLERLGLTRARGRLGGQLSGGMQRKLAVGMALVHAPRLLVLDEPTTGVDPVSRTELWRLISQAAATGTAVVVATTYVNEAERGTTALLLEAGRVLARGAPESIRAGVRGAVGRVRSSTQPSGLSWRRGVDWRVWSPSGDLPADATPVEADLEDAAVVAALAVEAGADVGSPR